MLSSRARWLALALLTLVSCGPAPFVTGSWRFDGKSFGLHETPSPDYRYFCHRGSEPGSVELALKVVWDSSDPSQMAYVTFFPLDDTRGVDVVMPWAHVHFAPSDCADRAGSATSGVMRGKPVLVGTLKLTCSKQDNTFDVDLSYACPVNGGDAARLSARRIAL